MNLTRHATVSGPRWAIDNRMLPADFDLRRLMEQPGAALRHWLYHQSGLDPVEGELLAPIEDHQEVWASGVTYLRSRQARQAESSSGDVYDRVYAAPRPELFFKAHGWRVVAPGKPVRIRADSSWNVPEPELTLVINRHAEIIGYTAGNDMSSRSIEGENPLYLPQAKIYDSACALGPAIRLFETEALDNLPIRLSISRGGETVFEGETSTARIQRRLEDLVAYLYCELSFPFGAFLMTGTGIVPPDSFSLAPGDEVHIQIHDLTLTNPVSA